VFVGSLYFWQIPAVHNIALLNPTIHYIMHITMLAAGMLFFFVIFDRRHPPGGLNFGLRQLMLVAGIVSNILAGSVTTLKEVVVYTAYDIEGRLFTLSALADEQTGGYIIWVPSSMMLLISILITIFRWNGYEVARYEKRFTWSSGNSAALEFPQTAEELRLKVAAPNRATRIMLALVPLSIFSVVTATVLAIHLGG
jgi:putative membrane protein